MSTTSVANLLDNTVQVFLRSKIPDGLIEEVEKCVRRFCLEGQIVIGCDLLVYAQRVDRLDRALALIDKQWEEFYRYQKPEICGHPDKGRSGEYLVLAYANLGIVPPWKRTQ